MLRRLVRVDEARVGGHVVGEDAEGRILVEPTDGLAAVKLGGNKGAANDPFKAFQHECRDRHVRTGSRVAGIVSVHKA